MRQRLPALLSVMLSAVLLPAALPAVAGTAEVRFEHPERFSDAGRGRDAESVRQVLSEHLEALARQQLPASQQLTLTITDIDLAGEIPLTVSARLNNVRVLGRHVDWPRITLRYTLRDGEQVLAQGSDVVSDMSYLQRSAFIVNDGRLPYERRMLTDWFQRQFVRPAGH